jgi:glucose-1-phosphate cytidylyltransferase
MRVVILAGGRGTRLAEETGSRPKPMVEVGGKPLLWHVMSIYARHGLTDFLVACGYRGEMIKEYFLHYFVRNSDFFVSLKTGIQTVVATSADDWNVGVVDTGLDTATGGRLLRLRRWIEDGTFMATYGDGVSDVPLGELLEFHKRHGKAATVTAVRPPARFGGLALDGEAVVEFSEKPQAGEGWINGGFFVFEPSVLDYIDGEDVALERAPLERLAADGELMAFRHEGFWQPMDTIRDKQHLEALWATGDPPWMKAR